MMLKLLVGVLLLAAIIQSTRSPNLKFITDLRWRLAYALNRFAVEFYEFMPYRHSGNRFVSPLSITNALSALYCGSRGKTKEELNSILMFDKANLTKRELFRAATMFSPQFLFGDDTQFYVFNTFNAILINPNSNLSVNAEFRRKMAEKFSVAVINVNFDEPSDTDLYTLNQLVISRTRRIRFYRSDINFPGDLMVISSAYLKAAWEYEFSPLHTTEETFFNRGLRSRAKKVQMMHMKNELNYYSEDSFKILELPFKDRVIRMFVILPRKHDGLSDLESQFTYIFLKDLRKLNVRNVSVSLPKFTLHCWTSMTPSLTDMGATELFDPELVDLSGMIENKELVVGEMAHKTFLSVTEGGLDTTATSLTNSTKSYSRTSSFKVNHPFFFIITDRRPRILFVGRINEL